MSHFLEQSGRTRVFREDFGLRVIYPKDRSQVEISVPEPVRQALLRLSIQTAEQFMSQLYSGPSSIAQKLNWQIPEVLAARQVLTKRLRGILAEGYLRTPPPLPEGSCGAFHPGLLDKPFDQTW